MQIVIFSAPDNFKGELEIVKQLLIHNVIFHLRKPGISYENLVTYLSEIPSVFHSKIVIHQHIEVLEKFQLKGFHCTRKFLGQHGKNVQKIRKKYSGYSFSKSCHTLEELDAINGYHYVFLSPVFDSISKAHYSSNYSLDAINSVLKNKVTPVIALGGINHKNILQLLKSNFSGIAVLGYIWNSSQPLENFKKLNKLLTL
ncbi:MAG: thiamine phosphate synthase [Flavobacteriales bacterium]|jgi:thiamine-phosphate pyrophosphorylase|nr:thiamine phosphate synthase [Flavobacteriales bacterium]